MYAAAPAFFGDRVWSRAGTSPRARCSRDPAPVIEEMDMKMKVSRQILVATLIGAFAPSVLAHGDDAAQRQTRHDLGSVLFKTSCTAEGQRQYNRALAMLHSFYFPETVKAFNAMGFIPGAGTPGPMTKQIEEDMRLFTTVIRERNLRFDT